MPSTDDDLSQEAPRIAALLAVAMMHLGKAPTHATQDGYFAWRRQVLSDAAAFEDYIKTGMAP